MYFAYTFCAVVHQFVCKQLKISLLLAWKGVWLHLKIKISGITKKYSLEVRARAVDMLEAGKTQKEVANIMEVSVRSVRNWWSKHKSCDSLADKKRSGRPKVLGRVERIILSKSVGKRKQSVRKLAKRMSARGYQGSKSTIQHHLKGTLGLRPYHRPVIRKLSEKNFADRLSFCKKLKRWGLSE